MYAEIKERIRKKCGSGSFGFNVLTLMSGTTVSQALPILVSPILTRLYSSGDFGGLALFQSLLAVASAFACLRYEMTIVLCRNDKEIVNMVAVSVAASVMTSSLLALTDNPLVTC
jgi:O-antigen/teichoic acid export membrane protein